MVRLCSDTMARTGLNLAQTFTRPKKLRTSIGGFWGGARAPPTPPLPPALFLDQTEARRAEKILLQTAPLPPHPYLKVWIRH